MTNFGTLETLTSIRQTPASISKNLKLLAIDFFFQTAGKVPGTGGTPAARFRARGGGGAVPFACMPSAERNRAWQTCER